MRTTLPFRVIDGGLQTRAPQDFEGAKFAQALEHVSQHLLCLSELTPVALASPATRDGFIRVMRSQVRAGRILLERFEKALPPED